MQNSLQQFIVVKNIGGKSGPHPRQIDKVEKDGIFDAKEDIILGAKEEDKLGVKEEEIISANQEFMPVLRV